jgi:hypothetical protein
MQHMANSMIGGVLDNNVWYVDSGASNHMTSHGEWFRDAKDLKTKYLKDVFHVPTITKNLVSIGQMVE